MSPRFLPVFLAAALAAVFCPGRPAWAARSELLPETLAAEHGLTRPWFTQVALDQGRGRLRDLVLCEGVLYAQTDKAVVHAIDAETGKTLWWKQVGQARYPSMTLDAKGDLVAVINGSRLYVLNRVSGDILYEKEVGGAPAAGPALSAQRVYVPITSGMIVGYRLQPPTKTAGEKGDAMKDLTAEEKSQRDADRLKNLRIEPDSSRPLFCQSYGKALVQPLVTRETVEEELVVWPTDRGFLNLASVDRRAESNLTLKYRLETGAAIVGRPAYLPPDPKLVGDSGLVITASRDGFVYVFQEKNGDLLWRFSTGEPIIESPAVIDDRVYVTTQIGRMYALAIKTVKTDKELWFAPDVYQFVAASKARVYGTNRVGRLVVLNAASGALLDVIPTERAPIKLLNEDTDRIYLGDDGGLIQCLREIEQNEPIVHGQDRRKTQQAEEEKPAAQKKAAGEKEKPAAKERAAPKTPAKKAAKKAEESADGA